MGLGPAPRTTRPELRAPGWVILLWVVIAPMAIGQLGGPIGVQVMKKFVPGGTPVVLKVTVRVPPDAGVDLPGLLASCSVDIPGVSCGWQPTEEGFAISLPPLPGGAYFIRIQGDLNGHHYEGIDYFIVEAQRRPPLFKRLGYYCFLGQGDVQPGHKIARMTLADWLPVLDEMQGQGLNTMFFCINGYTLAYPSQAYPELVDPQSENAQHEFLPEFIRAAHERGVSVYVLLATDDHALGFGSLHPEALRQPRDGSPRTGGRDLCLEQPLAQMYIREVALELVRRYPGLDGVAFHPTEVDPERWNPETRAAFLADVGKPMEQSTPDERRQWYNVKFAVFLRDLIQRMHAISPRLEMVMLNCWWQDDYAQTYAKTLPSDTKFCIWQYNLGVKSPDWYITKWAKVVDPSRIYYMPPGCYAVPEDGVELMMGWDKLIGTAHTIGATGCIFFQGWDLQSEANRRAKIAIANFPSTSFISDPEARQKALEALHENYLETRTHLPR